MNKKIASKNELDKLKHWGAPIVKIKPLGNKESLDCILLEELLMSLLSDESFHPTSDKMYPLHITKESSGYLYEVLGFISECLINLEPCSGCRYLPDINTMDILFFKKNSTFPKNTFKGTYIGTDGDSVDTSFSISTRPNAVLKDIFAYFSNHDWSTKKTLLQQKEPFPEAFTCPIMAEPFLYPPNVDDSGKVYLCANDGHTNPYKIPINATYPYKSVCLITYLYLAIVCHTLKEVLIDKRASKQDTLAAAAKLLEYNVVLNELKKKNNIPDKQPETINKHGLYYLFVNQMLFDDLTFKQIVDLAKKHLSSTKKKQ